MLHHALLGIAQPHTACEGGCAAGAPPAAAAPCVAQSPKPSARALALFWAAVSTAETYAAYQLVRAAATPEFTRCAEAGAPSPGNPNTAPSAASTLGSGRGGSAHVAGAHSQNPYPALSQDDEQQMVSEPGGCNPARLAARGLRGNDEATASAAQPVRLLTQSNGLQCPAEAERFSGGSGATSTAAVPATTLLNAAHFLLANLPPVWGWTFALHPKRHQACCVCMPPQRLSSRESCMLVCEEMQQGALLHVAVTTKIWQWPAGECGALVTGLHHAASGRRRRRRRRRRA